MSYLLTSRPRSEFVPAYIAAAEDFRFTNTPASHRAAEIARRDCLKAGITPPVRFRGEWIRADCPSCTRGGKLQSAYRLAQRRFTRTQRQDHHALYRAAHDALTAFLPVHICTCARLDHGGFEP